MRRHPHATWLAGALLWGGCSDEIPGTSDCTIQYLRLGAAPSNRVDLLVELDENQVKRIVRDDGEEDSAAIFYRFDSPELSAVLHELDDENDGTVDSTMDRAQRLVDRIDLYQVDAIADDGVVDSMQMSIPLETGGRFGAWRPARMFYTIPCGPSHQVFAEERQDGTVDIDIDLNEDGDLDAAMTIVFDGDAVQAWTVDNNRDGLIDFRGRAEYRDDGRIEQVEWRDWEFAAVAVASFAYDAEGRLVEFNEDMSGNGTVENQLVYAAACWEDTLDATQ